ncbi:MAG: cytochrome b [Merismopedia sp. SIO2A8]|nr:cytochrome b [Symploca sp. SIO2B6]NET51129.1 cytochrome b [Merismopedia sp. SIO2A8]
MKRRRNSAFQRLMSVHWWMACIYPALWGVGWFMVHLERENPVRSPLYDFHKSLGILTLMLLTWRIVVLLQVWWRKYTKRRPKFSLPWLKALALHSLLYGFMVGVPLSGFFLSNSFQSQNVKFFGLIVPDIFPQNQAALGLARNLHFWLSYVFLAFVILHMIDQRKVVRALWRRSQKWLQKRRKLAR